MSLPSLSPQLHCFFSRLPSIFFHQTMALSVFYGCVCFLTPLVPSLGARHLCRASAGALSAMCLMVTWARERERELSEVSYYPLQSSDEISDEITTHYALKEPHAAEATLTHTSYFIKLYEAHQFRPLFVLLYFCTFVLHVWNKQVKICFVNIYMNSFVFVLITGGVNHPEV